MSSRAKPDEAVPGVPAITTLSASLRVVSLLVMSLTVVALIVTWPLGAQLARSYPGDYGDPVFVTWVMGWVSDRLTHAAFDGFWTANIFFPERGTLAFSEHFIAQSLTTLPVYWATGNLILTYNVAFLLTFVLTGLGAFLLARAMTGSDVAGFVAAFVAAFNEYRLVYEVGHLHTLSIQWFPFALYALNRYFVTDRRRYLVASAVFLVLLNLSSIYYMAYCAPFVALFAIGEAFRTGRWREGRIWFELWATAAAAVVLTMPALLPYMDVQQRLGVRRSVEEMMLYSARVDHYRAALPGMAAAIAAAAIGIVAGLVDRQRRWPVCMLVLFLVLAVWLSFGPVVQLGDQRLDWPSLYAWLAAVPGYDGLRVPARFASLFFLFLALLAAIGVSLIERRGRLVGQVAGGLVIVVFLVRGTPDAIPMNVVLPSPGLAMPPPAYLTPAPALPAIYRAVEGLRPGAILAELPFGDPWYDLRYMFFSATHHRRLLNGYSGLFPPSFVARQRVLAKPLLDPGASAQAIGGATHVIVHAAAWPDDTGARLGVWLESYGATRLAEGDGAVLYELPLREGFAGLRPAFGR